MSDVTRVLSLSMLTLVDSLSSVTMRCLAADERQAASAADRRFDPAAAGVQVKVFTVSSGDALARAEMLRVVLGQGSSLARPIRIAADLRTNSIIAVGITEDLEVIRGILARLDDPAAYRSQAMQKPLADLPSEKGRSRPERPGLHDALVRPPPEMDKTHSGDAKANATAAYRHETQTTRMELDLQDAGLEFKAAKAELDRLNERYRKNPLVFSSSEMAKAQLAARCTEIRVEKLRAVLAGLRH